MRGGVTKMVKTRAPKYKTFDDRRYERVGSSLTTSKKVAVGLADFQRRVSKIRARVIPVSGGYEIYVRRDRR